MDAPLIWIQSKHVHQIWFQLRLNISQRSLPTTKKCRINSLIRIYLVFRLVSYYSKRRRRLNTAAFDRSIVIIVLLLVFFLITMSIIAWWKPNIVVQEIREEKRLSSRSRSRLRFKFKTKYMWRMISSRRMSRAVQVNMEDFGLIRRSGSLIIKGSQSFERVIRTSRQGERDQYGNRRLEGIKSWKTLKVPPTECDYWWWYPVPWPLLPLSLPSVKH